MQIISAEVLVTSPGRNFVTLRISTDDGISGLGDATLNGRELAVVTYLRDHVVPCLIGRDPAMIEDIWQYLYRGAYWRRGPVTMSAIGAVDTALWDIKGKALGVPVYELLGGASREGVLAYGHATGEDPATAIEAVGHLLGLGYRAIRVQSGEAGLVEGYDSWPGPIGYELVEPGLPRETVWSTPKYLASVPKLFARVRATYGDEAHLLHDVHHRLTPIEAARLGKELEPYHLFWLEDPTSAEQQESFRLIRRHTTTPLAVGEVFNTIHDATTLLHEQLIDFLRMSIPHSGGITHLRKIAALAELHQVRTGCHGATDLSPVAMAATLHFDLWVPNFGIQEYVRHTPETEEVFPHDYSFSDGYLHPGRAPGLGVEYQDDVAKRYEYQRAYLPINRLEDGTMFNW